MVTAITLLKSVYSDISESTGTMISNTEAGDDSDMFEDHEHYGIERTLTGYAVRACIAVTAVTGLSLTAMVTTLPATTNHPQFFDWYADRSRDFIQVFTDAGIATAIAFTVAVLLRIESLRQLSNWSGFILSGVASAATVVIFFQLLNAFAKGADLLLPVVKSMNL